MSIEKILKDKNNQILLENSPIVEKVEKQHKRLNDFVNIFCGTSKTGFRKSVISSIEYNNLDNKDKIKYVQLLETSDIQKYRYDIKNYIELDIYPNNVREQFKNKDSIFFARMTKKYQRGLLAAGFQSTKTRRLV